MANTAGYISTTARYQHPPVPKLKFTDAEKFTKKVNDFFASISVRELVKDENGEFIPDKYQIKWIKPPTIVGLANFLECDYRIFQDYETDKYINHPQMSPECLNSLKHTLARARQICHEYTLGALFTLKSAQGAIFALKTVYKEHGYSDDINICQTNKIEEKTVQLEQLPTEELLQLEKILTRALDFKKMDQIAIPADYDDEVYSDK